MGAQSKGKLQGSRGSREDGESEEFRWDSCDDPDKSYFTHL